MTSPFVPSESPAASTVVEALIRTASRMGEDVRSLWTARFGHVYGDLSGQRGLDPVALQADFSFPLRGATLHEVIFGLQTSFVLSADIIAAMMASPAGPGLLRAWAGMGDKELRTALRALSSGRVLAQFGVYGAVESFAFDWYVDLLDAAALKGVRDLLRAAAIWGTDPDVARIGDPLYDLYAAFIPRNLLHVLGEVYTPPWLARLLVDESGWVPGQTLIDPFCGSGVFLLAALSRAQALGVEPHTVLADVCGVDLNPIACVSARANIVLRLRETIRRGKEPIHMPVLSADALAPVILRAAEDLGPFAPRLISLDGESVSVARLPRQLRAGLARYGVHLDRWVPPDDGANEGAPPPEGLAVRERRAMEQYAAMQLTKADVLATNPPWVGWEYLSREYRSYLEPGWLHYGLYEARGRDAAFIKEDLSTLALISAWDNYLKVGGTSVAVLRPATMTSALAARGIRRLSLRPKSCPIRLDHVRVLDGIRPFPYAQADAACWRIVTGTPTTFPVDGEAWFKGPNFKQPRTNDSLESVISSVERRALSVRPAEVSDPAGRWVVGDPGCSTASGALGGKNAYRGRTGVFTGGANSVFYVEPIERVASEPARFRNVIERAKRTAPEVVVELEPGLVYEVVRGRDVGKWQLLGSANLLCPHTAETKMRAIPPETMSARYPLVLRYLTSMRSILDERKGFSGWETAFRDEAFYAIQRVGEYTFLPWKVMWRYIADDFIVAVVGPDDSGRPRLPNDKVMFIGSLHAEEAYFVCGVLSSDPVRWKVFSAVSGRQISPSAIEHIGVPMFSPRNALHREISQVCAEGHKFAAAGDRVGTAACLTALNGAVAKLFNLSATDLRGFQEENAQLHRAPRAKSEGKPAPAPPS